MAFATSWIRTSGKAEWNWEVGKPIWLAIIHPESIIGLRWENLAFSDIKKIERSESFIIHYSFVISHSPVVPIKQMRKYEVI